MHLLTRSLSRSKLFIFDREGRQTQSPGSPVPRSAHVPFCCHFLISKGYRGQETALCWVPGLLWALTAAQAGVQSHPDMAVLVTTFQCSWVHIKLGIFGFEKLSNN